jgi:hypothetical protein
MPKEVPIFPREALIQLLSGFSGCSVSLLSSPSNPLFVRKASTSPESSLRLRQQFNKLLAFQEYKFSSTFCPKILNNGYYNECFYIDLEYVQGLDLIAYLATADVSQLKLLANRLGNFLIEMGKLPSIEKKPENLTEAFYDKTFTIVEKCPWLPDQVKVNLFLNVKKLAGLMGNKSSLCHGDFTFENILIDKNNQIFLIDHLDSFFPHYWQDVSKLHQDLSGEWFRFRRSKAYVPKYTLAYLSDRVLESVCEVDQSYLSVHNGLVALVFARILPYTTGGESREFVLSRVSYYLNLFLNE